MLRLAAPVVLAELGWMTMGIVDTVMVGRLGPEAIGAVGVGSSLFMGVVIFAMGLMLGLDTLVSRAFGAAELEDCHRWLLHGVALAVAAGARGYLHKDASRAELRATVTQALADPTWRLAPRRLRSAEMGAAPTLTAREIQVLEGMSHGRSNAEIGRELFLSEDTVKTHARRLFRKLGAADRAHAVAKGFRLGLVP